ncbi:MULTISPECIES: transposase [Bradyrhizobium]|uniref:transposase n=1 Tax=Bradyrhizobium TaxID=374 RepID=UPI0010A94EDC
MAGLRDRPASQNASYECSEARWDTRAGRNERNLRTKVGEVSLRVPKLRQLFGRCGGCISLSCRGHGVSPSIEAEQEVPIEAWLNRPIEGQHRYIDGIVLKRTGRGKSATVNGDREILGICGGRGDWSALPTHLKERGLTDACQRHTESAAASSLRRLGNALLALVQQHLQPHPVDQGAGERGRAQGDAYQRGRW